VIENRRALALLEDLEGRRATRARLRSEVGEDHLLGIIHEVAMDAYSDALRMVAAALPAIVAEADTQPAPLSELELRYAYGDR